MAARKKKTAEAEVTETEAEVTETEAEVTETEAEVTETETEAAETETEAAETETEAAETEAVVYCGPTIKGVAKRNTVYKTVPKALSDYVENHKYAGALIVPVSQLGRMLARLRDSKSAESRIYSKISREL